MWIASSKGYARRILLNDKDAPTLVPCSSREICLAHAFLQGKSRGNGGSNILRNLSTHRTTQCVACSATAIGLPAFILAASYGGRRGLVYFALSIPGQSALGGSMSRETRSALIQIFFRLPTVAPPYANSQSV